MPRQCSVCNAEEYLLQINARLRAGESQSAIAKDFGLSEDALARHAKNHVRTEQANAPDAMSRLETLWQRCDELYGTSTKIGDTKTAIECLSKLSYVCEQLGRAQARASGFESLTIPEKVQFIRDDQPLMSALFDDIVRRVDDFQRQESLQNPPSQIADSAL